MRRHGHLIGLCTLVLLCGTACDRDQLEHARAGVSVRVPPGWQVSAPEQIATAHEQYDLPGDQPTPVSDTVLFKLMKYEEPTERLNPTVHVTRIPLDAEDARASAVTILNGFNAANVQYGATVIEPPSATKFKGLPAARSVIRKDLHAKDGIDYVFIVELWVIHRGDDIVTLQMSGAESGVDRATEEFAAIRKSLQVRR